MTRLPIVGKDNENWGTLLNEYLLVSHHRDGTLKGVVKVFNVRDYGAVGDGTGDDTEAIRRTIAAVQKSGRGTIYFPSGDYRVTGTLKFPKQQIIEIVGNGWSSTILWAFDGHLFHWPSDVLCGEVTVSDLKISSCDVEKKPVHAAFLCEGGAIRCYFDHLQIAGREGVKVGSGIVMEGITDSNAINDCQFWDVKGTGIRLGHGSEVRIQGGRIIGDLSRRDKSIGLHLTGNNGGVHVLTTDIIGLREGIRVENITGAGFNRELFLTHATLDSCWRGLALNDSSYVSITGCWAASCDQDNIHVEAARHPVLIVNGGTIFHSGVYDTREPEAQHGIVVNSGTFSLTGVTIHHNRGKGVWVPNAKVREYTIIGCRITDNGQGLDLKGSSYLVIQNLFARNKTENQFAGSEYRVADNLDSRLAEP